MISQAKNGAEVLIVDGLSTASLVNPEREAEHWAEAQSARLKMTGLDEPVVVIGVASGFHLQALKVRLRVSGHCGRIIAIDTCSASIEFAKVRVADVEYVHVEIGVDVDTFLAAGGIAGWILQPYTVLRHKPTYLRNGTSLRRVEAWILGRTPESFSAHLKLRPQIAAALNAERARKIAEVSLLSIRDLSKVWDIASELKSDRRVFRVLEELVR